MTDNSPATGGVTMPLQQQLQKRAAAVEPVSQIHLSLQQHGERSSFDAAQAEILRFAQRRAGASLPVGALNGSSFSTDDVGARRIEGVAISDPRYWSLRFDDDDSLVAGRSWVIEAALAEQGDRAPTLFGVRLQCIARRDNPPYQRSIPSFVKDVIALGNSTLDGRAVRLDPWIVDTSQEVEELVKLLLSPKRTADVVAISLPETSRSPMDALISCEKLARDLAGAAHVVVLSGAAAFRLSSAIGREFSVFMQAVRTYRPGFNPDIEVPFAHPLGLSSRILSWKGGAEAYRQFIASEVLKRTVEGSEAFRRLPSFAEAKRTAAELRRRSAKQAGSSNDELLKLAEEEIEQLKNDIVSEKETSGELLKLAEDERDRAIAEVQRLHSLVYYHQERIQSLEDAPGENREVPIPDSLSDLEEWAHLHLSGYVELHNRALRGAKESEYDDVATIYQALLLLRDLYVPMRRSGGAERKEKFDNRCKELGIEEQQTFSGNGAGEQGETYFIRMGGKRVQLDRHLKKGNSREPRRCFRLYFCWDDATNQVVVGWLPSHLQTRAS